MILKRNSSVLEHLLYITGSISFKDRGVSIRLLEVFYLKERIQKTKPDESNTIRSKCLISPGSAVPVHRTDNRGRS